MNQHIIHLESRTDFVRKSLQAPLHCRHPLKTLEQLNTMVLLVDSNSLTLEGRPRLTGDHPIWLGALALSLLLHGGLLLTELRAWQPPQSSASQTQQVSLSLTDANTPAEPQATSAEPLSVNSADPIEPVTETVSPAEPAPEEPVQSLEEAVVLTEESSAIELPIPEPEAAPLPEPVVETEPPPPTEPTATEAPRFTEQAPTPEPPVPTEENRNIATTPAPADSPSLAAMAPIEPGFSEADRSDLMDDYLQEIMKRLQSAFEYPRAAQRRRQQGEVVLELMIEGSGEIASVQLSTGSGHALLDDAALAMVRRLTPLPPLPDHFPDGRLQLGVPVVFRLQ